MPTPEQVEEVQIRLEDVIQERFAPDGEWMRPSDSPDAVPFDALTFYQKAGVLTSEVEWIGFDADQIVEVSKRVIDGEPFYDWMNDLPEGDLRERARASAREYREERWVAHHDRLPTSEDLAREDEAIRSLDWKRAEPPEPPPVTAAELEQILTELERQWPANDNEPQDAARENILADTFMLKRELGFVGFRNEYFNDLDALEDWPDPVQRELGLREAWDGVADYDTYRASLADVSTERLAEYRESLGSLLTKELSEGSVNLATTPEASRAEFDRRLDEAAEHGTSRVQHRDAERGIER